MTLFPNELREDGSGADVHETVSVVQALADYATLIEYLRNTLPANNSAIVGFGGSYGGKQANTH